MEKGKLHKLEPTIYQYTFGPGEPVLRIRSGDSVTVSTVDARGFDRRGNPLPEHKKQKSEFTKYQQSNPLIGPIWVEEAKPSDLLKINIREILLNREYAWSALVPHFGAFTGESEGKDLLLNEPLSGCEYRWELDLNSQTGTLRLSHSKLKEIQVPLHPFIGSIGVAPRFGRVETALIPGEYGGNMDCVETKAGAILYLPVWVKGAYLSFGDVHAAQGDGEICGVALETTARVTLEIKVIKNKTVQWPRIENATHIMVAGSARPLMNAVRIAHIDLIKWLIADYGFDKWEALQVLSQVGTMRVGNIVDPNYTVVAKFPKKYLS